MGCSRISKAAILLGIFLLNLSQSVLGRFVVEKNSLRVTSPDNIKGTYDSAIGNFGIPQYGGSMAGTVLYPKENQKGCRAFVDFGISFKPKPGALPTFLLIDRGGMYTCPAFVNLLSSNHFSSTTFTINFYLSDYRMLINFHF